MPTDNSILYKCVADILRFLVGCKYIEDAGGYIVSTGMLWPIDTPDGKTVYYYINMSDKETRFLPDFWADLSTAEIVTDQDEILALFTNLLDYIETVNELSKVDLSQLK